MEEIINILVKIIVTVLSLLASYLCVKLSAHIKEKIKNSSDESLTEIVNMLCEAAEQQLKKDDPDGSKRLQYVQEQLVSLGIEVSDYVQSKIEASVWSINLKNKE